MIISDKFASIPNSSLPSGILSSTITKSSLLGSFPPGAGLVTSYLFLFFRCRRDRCNDLNSSPIFSLHSLFNEPTG